jgi:hypothetical protein
LHYIKNNGKKAIETVKVEQLELIVQKVHIGEERNSKKVRDEKVYQLVIQEFYEVTEQNVYREADNVRNTYSEINFRNGSVINKITEQWTNNKSCN